MNHITCKIQDDIVRSMNRKQYKESSRFMRILTRAVEAAIDWDKLQNKFCDLMLYGRAQWNVNDMLK